MFGKRVSTSSRRFIAITAIAGALFIMFSIATASGLIKLRHRHNQAAKPNASAVQTYVATALSAVGGVYLLGCSWYTMKAKRRNQ